MPEQAPLRLIKAWHQHRSKSEANSIPKATRGFYVLYNRSQRGYEVVYIGIAGTHVGKGVAAIRSRIRAHVKQKMGWTHFSYFEVHDNITGEEIRELEALLLQIFWRDARIKLTNVQTGSRKFRAILQS